MEILLYYHCKLWLKMPIFLTLIRNPFKPKGKITWPVWTVKKLIFKFMQNGKQFQVPPHIKKRRSLEDLYFPISKILNGIEMVLCRHKDRHQTSSESRKKKLHLLKWFLTGVPILLMERVCLFDKQCRNSCLPTCVKPDSHNIYTKT